MRHLLLALCLAGIGCASTSASVDTYQGLYSTHFEGIPDRAAICAVVRNTSTEALSWVQLRVHSESHLGATPATWRSNWLYHGRLLPGESVALSLPGPPVSDSLRVEILRAGRGRAPRNGRRAEVVDACTETDLYQLLSDLELGRTAPNREIHGMAGSSPQESDSVN
ncbi:MAG: hypothetical protein VX614_10685 [Myxococcota bacterium]|nr:hypothetical protein [Myxococcota bacterium]